MYGKQFSLNPLALIEGDMIPYDCSGSVKVSSVGDTSVRIGKQFRWIPNLGLIFYVRKVHRAFEELMQGNATITRTALNGDIYSRVGCEMRAGKHATVFYFDLVFSHFKIECQKQIMRCGESGCLAGF